MQMLVTVRYSPVKQEKYARKRSALSAIFFTHALAIFPDSCIKAVGDSFLIPSCTLALFTLHSSLFA